MNYHELYQYNALKFTHILNLNQYIKYRYNEICSKYYWDFVGISSYPKHMSKFKTHLWVHFNLFALPWKAEMERNRTNRNAFLSHSEIINTMFKNSFLIFSKQSLVESATIFLISIILTNFLQNHYIFYLKVFIYRLYIILKRSSNYCHTHKLR